MAHVEEKIKPSEKPDILLEAAMTKTPQEVSKVYKSLGAVDYTAYALGLACRFRGLETVKVLIENGAKFDYDAQKIKRMWRFDPLISPGVNFAAAMLDQVGIVELNDLDFLAKKYGVKPIPMNERLKLIDYLCETAEKTGFDKDGLLFYSFFSGNREITNHLKSKGAKISEIWAKIVTGGGWDDETKNQWFDYCYLVERLSDDNFIPGISALVNELGGKKLHYTEWLWHIGLAKRHNIPGFYNFLIENYDISKINKGKTMRCIIDAGSVDGLAAVAELGWLKMPKKRDEMIAYSNEKGKTECTAWLLDFKNRNFDLAAERKKAEKKEQRELNADPNSAAELKKIWSWKKRDDGTLIITNYKGNKTKITVPEKIGKDTVTAIGEYAFSPEAKRLKYEQHEFRKTITEIILPDTITKIEECAFLDCLALVHFEIPPKITEISKECLRLTAIKEIVIGGNVKKICWGAFSRCFDLKTAVLCEGVEEIESAAFYNCGDLETIEIPRSVTKIAYSKLESPFFVDDELTVVLYKGSYAEKYCKENKIPFKYKE